MLPSVSIAAPPTPSLGKDDGPLMEILPNEDVDALLDVRWLRLVYGPSPVVLCLFRAIESLSPSLSFSLSTSPPTSPTSPTSLSLPLSVGLCPRAPCHALTHL